MKNIKLPANLSRSLNGLAFKMKKHAPEILVVAGVGGTIATTVRCVDKANLMALGVYETGDEWLYLKVK